MQLRRLRSGRFVVALAGEDDATRLLIAQVLNALGAVVHQTSTMEGGLGLLAAHPHLVVTDMSLPGSGNALELVKAATAQIPSPTVVVVSGSVTPLEAFRVAQAGAAAFIPKPVDPATFIDTVEVALEQAPHIEHQIALQVGRVPYAEVLERVRRIMLTQALALAGGNRIRAAEELKLTRQAVQYMIRSLAV